MTEKQKKEKGKNDVYTAIAFLSQIIAQKGNRDIVQIKSAKITGNGKMKKVGVGVILNV